MIGMRSLRWRRPPWGFAALTSVLGDEPARAPAAHGNTLPQGRSAPQRRPPLPPPNLNRRVSDAPCPHGRRASAAHAVSQPRVGSAFPEGRTPRPLSRRDAAFCPPAAPLLECVSTSTVMRSRAGRRGSPAHGRCVRSGAPWPRRRTRVEAARRRHAVHLRRCGTRCRCPSCARARVRVGGDIDAAATAAAPGQHRRSAGRAHANTRAARVGPAPRARLLARRRDGWRRGRAASRRPAAPPPHAWPHRPRCSCAYGVCRRAPGSTAAHARLLASHFATQPRWPLRRQLVCGRRRRHPMQGSLRWAIWARPLCRRWRRLKAAVRAPLACVRCLPRAPVRQRRLLLLSLVQGVSTHPGRLPPPLYGRWIAASRRTLSVRWSTATW